MQHQLISLWNNRADTKAKLGCKKKQRDKHEWVSDGDFSCPLLYRVKLVRGDPRKLIRKAFWILTSSSSRLLRRPLYWHTATQPIGCTAFALRTAPASFLLAYKRSHSPLLHDST
jgi:hypothetical protein